MADEPAAKPAKPAKPPKRTEGVRFFRGPEVTLVRMGREVATYRGEYGRLDLAGGRVELRDGSVKVGDAELSAAMLFVDVPAREIAGSGKVRLEEKGVRISADRVKARLTLTGLRFGGTVRLRAESREAAQALLDAGVV